MNVAEPAPALRTRDASLSGRVSTDLSDLLRFRHLIWYMAMSSLAVESRGTKLGRSWWVIEPLLLMGVYTMLVRVIFHSHVPNFPLVVLAGIISFEFFARSVGRSMGMLKTAQSSMLHVPFPRSVVPLAVTLSETIRFVIAIAAYVGIAAAFGVTPTPATLLAIPFMVVEIVFTLGASYFFAAQGIFFRDLTKITEYLFWTLFQLGCGMFPLSQISSARVQHYVLFNPLTTFFEGVRTPLLYGTAPHLSITVVGSVVALSVLVLIGGYLYFLRRAGAFSKVLI